jgi:methionyl-tRNA formyltransferase
MRLIFFGTAPFSTQILEVLAQKHEVVAVVTSPDAMVGRRRELTETAIAKKATSLGIRVCKPRSLKKNELFRDELKALNADGCVLFAYGKIIPQEFLEMTRIGILNIHPSLLPFSGSLKTSSFLPQYLTNAIFDGAFAVAFILN